MFFIRPQLLMLAAMLLAACGGVPGDDQEASLPVPIPEDLVDITAGKADNATFSPNKLIADHLFTDSQYLGAEEIQAFFELNPYGARSYLADYVQDRRTAAEMLAQSGVEFEINPLVLLTKLQVETSLVFATSAPSAYLLDRAMGCGCPDGLVGCTETMRGFPLQIRCAAKAFRNYLDDLEENGETISGWRVGGSKYTLDDVLVMPENRATAALYTYTPWVLPYQGGNWLFRNVYLKFSQHVLQGSPNHRWIGGSCAGDANCPYDEGVCHLPDSSAGSSRDTGYCTRPCDFYCPESAQPNTAATFCVDLPDTDGIDGAGWCLSKCDPVLFGDNNGCPSGFQCISTERHDDPSTVANICLPGATGS